MDKKYSKVNVVIGKKQELTEEQQNCDVLCVTMFKDQKDKKIADLEAKLAESERFMQANGFKNWKEAQDALNGKFECIFDEKHELWKKLVAENAQLKQQLKESFTEKDVEGLIKDREETIKFLKQQLAEKDAEVQSWKDGTMVVKLGKLEEQLAEKDKEIKELKKEIRDELVDNNMAILELQQSQNQTAIAELEKLRKDIEFAWSLGGWEGMSLSEITNFIDQQINELKGDK